MYTEVQLPFGENRLKVKLPAGNLITVLEARQIPGLADEPSALLAALRSPLDSPPLLDCFREDARIAILVSDNTRACPDDRLLPVILQEITRKVSPAQITIIVALGLHAPLTDNELINKLGREVVENYRVVNHDPAQTVCLGTTSFGTPVDVNRVAAEADFRLSTGFIEPHFFAGFSGGRKSVLPGVSSARSIRHNHGYAMIAHPAARAGRLEGNPIHEDMLEAARLAGLNFIVNVLLNKEKRITHVVAGNPVSAHRQACRIEDKIVRIETEQAVDITLVTNGGAPLDLDLYQTVKGYDTAAGITRPGGTIIMASSCHNGVGPEAFRKHHAACTTPQEVYRQIEAGGQDGVDWQNQVLARAQMEHTLYLYSNLKEDEVRRMMITPVQSVEEGLHMALDRLGEKAAIAVIPEGPLVLPVVSAKNQ